MPKKFYTSKDGPSKRSEMSENKNRYGYIKKMCISGIYIYYVL